MYNRISRGQHPCAVNTTLTTPTGVGVGKHVIALNLTGYYDATITVTLGAGSTIPVVQTHHHCNKWDHLSCIQPDLGKYLP